MRLDVFELVCPSRVPRCQGPAVTKDIGLSDSRTQLMQKGKVSSDVSSDLEDDSTLSAAVRCDIEPDGCCCCCLDRCKYSEHLKLVSQCQSKQTGAAGPVSCVWYVCVFVFVSG